MLWRKKKQASADTEREALDWATDYVRKFGRLASPPHDAATRGASGDRPVANDVLLETVIRCGGTD